MDISVVANKRARGFCVKRGVKCMVNAPTVEQLFEGEGI